jgi:hypothetical protein
MRRDFLRVLMRLHNLVHQHRGVNGKKRRIMIEEDGEHLKMTFSTQ